MRTGATIIELAIVLALIAVLLSVASPMVGALRDRAAVGSATTEVIAALTTARHLAVAHRTRVAVLLDAAGGIVTVATEADTFQLRRLRDTHGVSIEATRDSIAYAPTGRGYGAANTRIILARGRAADTINVSRLGRVRR